MKLKFGKIGKSLKGWFGGKRVVMGTLQDETKRHSLASLTGKAGGIYTSRKNFKVGDVSVNLTGKKLNPLLTGRKVNLMGVKYQIETSDEVMKKRIKDFKRLAKNANKEGDKKLSRALEKNVKEWEGKTKKGKKEKFTWRGLPPGF